MDASQLGFLRAVLGPDGATAMARAAKKDPRLEAYLLPRAILGWVMAKNEFEGTLPGVDALYLRFAKTENFTGSIGVGASPTIDFVAGNEYELVAEIAHGMGLRISDFSGPDRLLVTLGKSVDALLTARQALRALSKGGVDLPGKTATPFKQKGPMAPIPPGGQSTGAKMAKPKLPKMPVLKVEKKDLDKPCQACGGKIFKSQKFVGCVCWRDLAKSSVTTIYGDGVAVEFPKADKDAVLALLKDFKNG